MICPIVAESIIMNGRNREELLSHWKTVFCIASVIHSFGVIFYAVFASGEQQDWAKEEEMEIKSGYLSKDYGTVHQ